MSCSHLCRSKRACSRHDIATTTWCSRSCSWTRPPAAGGGVNIAPRSCLLGLVRPCSGRRPRRRSCSGRKPLLLRAPCACEWRHEPVACTRRSLKIATRCGGPCRSSIRGALPWRMRMMRARPCDASPPCWTCSTMCPSHPWSMLRDGRSRTTTTTHLRRPGGSRDLKSSCSPTRT